ncbi:MAG: acyltransferase [Hyphomicrobiaceae bacterium]|nr:acyltransferase [Hyphomicrobiaceae bacterium]
MRASELSATSHRTELDGLRAVAVSGVVAFHLGLPHVSGGFLGVDVFFVLSGFLITRLIISQIGNGQFSILNFYARRARRLLPAAFATIAISLLAGLALLGPQHLEAAAQSAFFATLSLANVHFWLTADYFDVAREAKPFLHFWSLSAEEQFYLFWPALLLAITRIGRRALLSLAILAIAAASFLASLIYQSAAPEAVFFLTPFRIWQLGIGALIATAGIADLKRTPEILRLAAPVLTAAGLLLIVHAFAFSQAPANDVLVAAQAAIGAALVISAPPNTIARLILANPLSAWLGRISYSVYLWHWPIVIFLLYYLEDARTFLFLLSATALTILFGWISYRTVEQPFRGSWTRGDARTERLAVVAGSCAIALFIIASASLIWNQGGWDWRLAPGMRQEVAAARLKPRPNCQGRKLDGLAAPQCVYGLRSKDIDMAVIGDSHAATLSAGLSLNLLYENRTGLDLHRNDGLPLLDTESHFLTAPSSRSMNDHFAAAFSAKPKFIVLHARFSRYWLGRGSKFETNRPDVYIGPTGKPADYARASSQRQFTTALRETIRAIRERGIIPVVVGPIPNPGTDVLQCFTRPLLRSHETAMAWCNTYTQDEARARNKPVIEVLRAIAKDENAIFHDPTNLFCKAGETHCRLVQGSKILYRDDDHLSEYGARVLARSLLNALPK